MVPQFHLLQQLLSILFRHGRVQGRDGGALLLAKRESRHVGNKNLMLSINIS
uniref:Uncharacterized protein n=1 Tax=Rhizophora mucronata TaxID=61149 RepID=A0A2P2J2R6_RHIMU